jgi:hypothetical protein
MVEIASRTVKGPLRGLDSPYRSPSSEFEPYGVEVA